MNVANQLQAWHLWGAADAMKLAKREIRRAQGLRRIGMPDVADICLGIAAKDLRNVHNLTLAAERGAR